MSNPHYTPTKIPVEIIQRALHLQAQGGDWPGLAWKEYSPSTPWERPSAKLTTKELVISHYEVGRHVLTDMEILRARVERLEALAGMAVFALRRGLAEGDFGKSCGVGVQLMMAAEGQIGGYDRERAFALGPRTESIANPNIGAVKALIDRVVYGK